MHWRHLRYYDIPIFTFSPSLASLGRFFVFVFWGIILRAKVILRGHNRLERVYLDLPFFLFSYFFPLFS